jgi:hypothetical protein
MSMSGKRRGGNRRAVDEFVIFRFYLGSSPSAALSPRFLGRRFRDPGSGTFP